MNSKKTLAYYSRFKDLPWFEPISKSTVMIFGQGGIGSHLTFFLARTGANLITVDFDTVEDHNIAGQLYGKQDIGQSKVEAMAKIIDRLCGEVNITPLNVEATNDESAQWYSLLKRADVICVSFDSIKARKLVFEKWLKNHKENSLFVDGRMSAQQGQVFTVSSKHSEKEMDEYRDTFFDDASIPELPCTAKATTHCGSLTASLMTAQVANWMNNQVPGGFAIPVTRRLDFNLPLMMFDEPKPATV